MSWTSTNSIAQTILAVMAALGAMTYIAQNALGSAKRLRQASEDPAEVLRRRIQDVNRAFRDASRLMHDLQRDLAAQQAARESIVADAEHHQRLLQLDKDQADNIRQILLGETKTTIRAARRRELGIFVAGLILSAALSIPIGIWVNSIS
ncbi:hypothetical protein ACI2LC_18715 [Nonomuraea wenchangensis]|uniref:hypothetical protein n=1 Tax=Nonomuraea wenchangensis TaxID=568860 RepID=UPI00341BE94B